MMQGALDRKRFEAIEAYVLGTMEADDRERFDREIVTDALLRAEVELQRENMLAIELGGLSRELKRIGADQGREEDRRAETGAWRPYLKYAAAVALLIIGGLWWFSRPTTGERLFAEHFTADPGLPVAMGMSGDPIFADAMISFKEGKYGDARAKWSILLQGDPLNDTLHFYMASAALAEGDAAYAIGPFTTLAEDSTTVFRQRATWYLFLAYLLKGDLDQARSVDLSADPGHAEEAKAILTELGD